MRSRLGHLFPSDPANALRVRQGLQPQTRIPCRGNLDKKHAQARKWQLKIPPRSAWIVRYLNEAIVSTQAAIKPLTVQQPTVERNNKMQQTLTRWEPLREMEEFQNRLSTLFGRPSRRGNGRKEITLP